MPDFRKTMTEEHTQLLGQLFEHLTQGGERLPEDWIESHVKRLEHYDGDIDTLMSRIAHVRTWTYISHRPDWIQRAIALAGARPRHRGQAFRRASRQAHPKVCG